MRMRYESVKGDPFFLFGVNADICAWISEAASDNNKHSFFISKSLFRKYPEISFRVTGSNGIPKETVQSGGQLTRDDYVLALGKRNPYKRRLQCIDIIKKLWASYHGLGPYPLLDELIEFENNRVFYSKYRDHAAHQLMNYLLGLYIYTHCKPIREKILEEITASMPDLNTEQVEQEFILRWFIASIIHDIGYVIEDPKADPAKNEKGEYAELWIFVQERINDILCNCLARTPLFTTKGLTDDSLVNDMLQDESALEFRLPKSISTPEEIRVVDGEDWLKKIDSALKASGIVDAVDPLSTYYELAHENTPQGQNRPGFWDHGITSALVLLRVWYALRDKIHAVIKFNNLHDIGLSHCKKLFDNLAKLEDGDVINYQLCDVKSILAAAEAISLHNINKDIWATHSKAFREKFFTTSNYFICLITKDATHNPKPLAFLLALVDTLQDWHRPSFELSIDQARSTSLIDKDLSITFENGTESEKILLYYRKLDEFEKVKNRLLAFLDTDAINQLIEFNTKGTPQFLVDRSFSCYVPSFESYELNEVFASTETDEMEIEDDYTMEKCLSEEDAKKIKVWGGIDPRKRLLEEEDIRICPKNKKPCILRTAPLVTLAELGQCTLALQDTMLVYKLLKELKNETLGAVLTILDKPRFDVFFTGLVKRFRYALINIPVTLDENLKLKCIYDPANIEGFLKCRVGDSKAKQFYADYNAIKIIADKYQVPSELFEQLRGYDFQLNRLDGNMTYIIIHLGDIIKARTSETESEIKKHVSHIKEVKSLGKMYENINKAFPHINNKMQRIW